MKTIALTDDEAREFASDIEAVLIDGGFSDAFAARLRRLAAILDAAPPAVDPSHLACNDFSPAAFKGRWRDWHRGSGCTLDDGQPRTAAGVEEITALEVDHPAARGKVAT